MISTQVVLYIRIYLFGSTVKCVLNIKIPYLIPQSVNNNYQYSMNVFLFPTNSTYFEIEKTARIMYVEMLKSLLLVLKNKANPY